MTQEELGYYHQDNIHLAVAGRTFQTKELGYWTVRIVVLFDDGAIEVVNSPIRNDYGMLSKLMINQVALLRQEARRMNLPLLRQQPDTLLVPAGTPPGL